MTISSAYHRILIFYELFVILWTPTSKGKRWFSSVSVWQIFRVKWQQNQKQDISKWSILTVMHGIKKASGTYLADVCVTRVVPKSLFHIVSHHIGESRWARSQWGGDGELSQQNSNIPPTYPAKQTGKALNKTSIYKKLDLHSYFSIWCLSFIVFPCELVFSVQQDQRSECNVG